jgi:hypothetical protein
LAAYGYAPPVRTSSINDPCADGHVHQGAALPFEVTLHWVARAVSSVSGPTGEPPVADTDDVEFAALPLLLVMHAVLTKAHLDWPSVLRLGGQAASGDRAALDELSLLLTSANLEEPSGLSSLVEIEAQKLDARQTWDPVRRVGLLRLESVLHAAVTQRKAGLDVFVGLFERYASLRRKRLPKDEYFRRAIAEQVVQSGSRLRRLELRLGELVSNDDFQQAALEAEYRAALQGYRRHVDGKEEPVLVTFPLGLIKPPSGAKTTADNWRFNPKGIYDLVERLIDVLEAHPALAPFVDGIDVCGLEESQPNWLFAPAFARFADATANLRPRPACRFHAGEWQWTPLHGLRRIAEFMAFPLPAGTPRRIGHGLALDARDWRRFGEEPLDELFDDLLWARSRLDQLEGHRSTRRLVERLLLDLRPFAHSSPVLRDAEPATLVAAYDARMDVTSLERISFLVRDGERLRFLDYPVATVDVAVLKVLAATLARRRDAVPTVSEALRAADQPGLRVDEIHQVLVGLYDLLAPEIIDDVRWGGVVVEACPTSNVLAGGVRGHGEHPMRTFVKEGILTTINTDDPALFHSWLPEELEHASGQMRVPVRQVGRSGDLSMRIVAPALAGIDLSEALDTALKSLQV